VFTARYTLNPYIKQIRFVFKGLINDTEAELKQDRKVNSYLRETDVLLLRVYSEVAKRVLGLELAALKQLAAILMLVDRLAEVLQQITVHLPRGLNFLRPVKSEFMYVFYLMMQVHTVTFDGYVRLLIQIPLREMQSVCTVYKIIPSLSHSEELGGHIQSGYADTWFAISADHRKLVMSWSQDTIVPYLLESKATPPNKTPLLRENVSIQI
jgi:hypothetical protein